MKKYFLIILFVLNIKTPAQFNVNAGMGLCYFSASDMRDYINYTFANSANELHTFNSSADFFVEFGYDIKRNYQLAVEYNFNIFSFNSPLNTGVYNLSVNRHKPSVIAYYVLLGNGYRLKAGIGTGIRILQVEETILGKSDYSATGMGFLLKAQGDTKLSENLYALIAGELRYDLPGKIHTYEKETIDFNSVSIALKLGVSYYF